MFRLDKIVNLRHELESMGSQIKENETPILIGMQKPLKGFKIPKELHQRLMKN